MAPILSKMAGADQVIPNSPAAHNLLHQGAIALARDEAARNAMDGAMARLKAENAKLRSLLTRVDAIDWGGTVHMAPAFVAEIREALKGGVRCG